MSTERFKMFSFVSLILRKEQNVFLIRRFNTGSGDGFYACAGGKVDGNETMTQAIIREAKEELGIILDKDNLKVVHVLHKKDENGKETVGFFMEATVWQGEPRNMEPDKHDDSGWFCLNNLPQNTLIHLLHVLEQVKKDIFYSELGW